jgi:hypothetical protein
MLSSMPLPWTRRTLDSGGARNLMHNSINRAELVRPMETY